MTFQPAPAKAFQHGKLVGEFKDQSITRTGMMLAPFILMSTLFVVIIGILLGMGISIHDGEVVVILLLSLGFSLCMAGIAGHFLIRAFLNRDLRVQVFEEGLVLARRGANQALRWSDIASVAQSNGFTFSIGSSHETYHLYTIQMQRGEKHSFGGFKFEVAFNLIQRKVSTSRI